MTHKKVPSWGMRHGQCMLLFLAGLVGYWSRVNVSVAVVAMTNPTSPDFEVFDWDEEQKSYIFSSFYWGYILTQLPGGGLAQRYGTKLILLVTILIPSILTLLTPICVQHGGWQLYCALRALQGFFSGGIFPTFHVHLSNWAPLIERNFLGALSYSGVELGTGLSLLLSGLVSQSSMGWPGIFYIPGCLGVFWSLLWWVFGANCPNDVRRLISEKEKKYLENHLATPQSQARIAVPWRAILTSLPFYALIIARLSHACGFTALLNETPRYLNSVMKLDIQSNGVYSSLSYLLMWILGYVFLMCAEIFARRSMSLTTIRKSFNSLSQWGPALALIGLAFTPADQLALAIVFLSAAIALGAASTIGSMLNGLDLSPNHVGVLMGIANTGANLVSLIVPLMVGAVVQDEKNRSQWQIVFFIAAGIYLVGNLIYVVFGSAEKQPWNEPKPQNSSSQQKSVCLEICT